MKTKRVYTKNPYVIRSLRLPQRDLQLWETAAAALGLSKSEFLRDAIRDKAQGVIGAPEKKGLR